VCFIELESPKQQPALVRALGAKIIHGSACLDIPVSEEFEGGCKVGPIRLRTRPATVATQATN